MKAFTVVTLSLAGLAGVVILGRAIYTWAHTAQAGK